MYLHPTDYPIIPKQWRIVDKGSKRMVAVMMPYPTMDNGAKCVNDDAYLTEDCNYDNDSVKYMRVKCGSCPLLTSCREWGIAHEGSLMFGGLTPTERKVIRAERGQVLLEPSNAHIYGMGTSHTALVGNQSGWNDRSQLDSDVYAGDLDLEVYPLGTYPPE